MKDIKTKGSRSNRIVDESADLASKMKQGLVRSKDQFQNLSDDGQVTPEEYAQDKIKYWSEDAVHDAAHGSKETAKKTYDGGKKLVEQIKQKRRDGDSIKQTAKSTGKQSFKTMKKDIKTAGKSTHKGVKTAESSARTTIKTTEKAAKTAEKTLKASQKAAKASAKAAKRSAQAAKKAAETAAKTAKAAVKATIAAVKAIVAGIKSLVAAIAAGGWVAVVIILVIVMVALIVGSCFGLFYSAGDTDGLTMQSAISDINAEYQAKIEEAKNSSAHDVLELKGSRARWQEVLAVYAVKTATDPDNAQEVATMDEDKLDILKSVFWDMHEISKKTETKKVKEYTETTDSNGNVTVTETEISKTVLTITVKHLTLDEMKSKYGFNDSQKAQLDEMLSEDKSKLWSGVLYGTNNADIVAVAATQFGNAGGQPYWSWMGFNSRVEWCACFVSWCANECGYIDAGVIPKTAGCITGVNWFKDRGEWQDRTYTPQPGDIIYFDWDNKGAAGNQDGLADHVGIVEKIIDDKVFTIEGNTGDQCAERTYTIGYYEILGYGTPAY